MILRLPPPWKPLVYVLDAIRAVEELSEQEIEVLYAPPVDLAPGACGCEALSSPTACAWVSYRRRGSARTLAVVEGSVRMDPS